MTTPRLPLALLLLSACGSPPPTDDFARRLITAVINADKAGYARCHVQEGDTTADGSAALLVEPGERLPDDAWLAAIEKALLQDRAKIEMLRTRHGEVAFESVLKTADEEPPPERGIASIQAVVKCKEIRYVVTLGPSVESSRGRVLRGPLGMSIRKE